MRESKHLDRHWEYFNRYRRIAWWRAATLDDGSGHLGRDLGDGSTELSDGHTTCAMGRVPHVDSRDNAREELKVGAVANTRSLT